MAGQVMDEGTKAALAANGFTRMDFSFVGWAERKDAPSATYVDKAEYTMGNADVILYALWSPLANTINFNLNGGSGDIQAINASVDSPVTLPTSVPARGGYTFLGWSEDPQAAVATYAAGGQFTLKSSASVTLYAVWSPNACSVLLDPNGGSGQLVEKQVKTDELVTLSEASFAKTGYALSGWSTDNKAGTAAYLNGANYTATGADVTFYAVWRAQTYSIVFDKNGGTGNMGAQSFQADHAVTLQKNTFSRLGYTFAGWSADKAATSATYRDEASIQMGTAGITLYAVWMAGKSVLSFDANEGGGTMSGMNLDTDSTITLPANSFQRVGYSFAGWAES